jgi:hypothetical protein
MSIYQTVSNDERPHQALAYRTSAQVYGLSVGQGADAEITEERRS